MKSYFKGWYFKIQSEAESIAFIPYINIDGEDQKAAGIQIVTPDFTDYAAYDYSSFSVGAGSALRVSIGTNEFSENGLKLNINTGRHLISGELRFGKLYKLRYDIMGPFCAVPFMECRHSVFSLWHCVSGKISIDGKDFDFDDAVGYIEGDRGRSFPEEYLWTQCITEGASLMLSVAKILVLGGHFTGVIGAIMIDGREFRLATYLGAGAAYIANGRVVIKQGNYVFTAELLEKGALPLLAPISGRMVRPIHENISCRARYKLTKNGDILLEFESGRAGFEYEYKR